MKALHFVLFCSVFLIPMKIFSQSNCNMSVTYSEMAFEKFKNAYKSDTVDHAKVFIKKGIEEAEQASAYALICNCPLAKNYALNAVTFGIKAGKADNLEEVKKQSKKAMDMALDVMTATPACNQNSK
ncbi:hypothetical protein N0B16_09520 [Chryseobacterium sp. GMJ5]|uniref:Uncharacterized protein n=1 Tax=Chryseobacterium gilvum TaxID=2976534 RepID=A0ABT2VXG2_9FLAO|nr:hypothetical protein [Chryseobacterium gilvum]MCU7614671.1 hypothetical protein [Chryseobacterium gilvum]